MENSLIAPKTLNSLMQSVTLSDKISDPKMAESLRKASVLNASGAAAQRLLWKTLADASKTSWKDITDNSGEKYSNFAKFALDFVPGLSRGADGKEVKESSIRAYLAAGEVIQAIPEIESKGFSADILNSLHSMLDNDAEKLAQAVRSGELDNISGKTVRQWVKANKTVKGGKSLPKPQRFFKVERLPADGGESKIDLLSKEALMDYCKTTITDGDEIFFNAANDWLVFIRIPKGKKPMAATFPRESQSEAEERAKEEARKRDAEVNAKTLFQHMEDKLVTLSKALLPAFAGDAEKAIEAAKTALKLEFPHSYDAFIKTFEEAGIEITLE